MLGDIRVVGQPINLTDNPQPEALGATPELGQHTDAILAGLGYNAAAIADLRARGAISYINSVEPTGCARFPSGPTCCSCERDASMTVGQDGSTSAGNRDLDWSD